MKALWIFDRNVLEAALPPISSSWGLDLFALTGDWRTVERVKERSKAASRAVAVLDSARLVDAEVNDLRSKIGRWSADLGDRRVRGRLVKERFLLPGREISSWWFSLLSEKNTLKTDAFFRLAQVQAVSSLLKSGEYGTCILSIGDADLRGAIRRLCGKHSVTPRLAPTTPESAGLAQRLRGLLMHVGLVGEVIHALAHFFRFASRSSRAKRAMRRSSSRFKGENAVLFVTYFPSVVPDAARRGSFRNTMALPLQEKMEELKKPVVWLLMYVPVHPWTYEKAVGLARNLAENGEPVFLLEEFFTPRAGIRTVFQWTAQIVKYIRLAWVMDSTFLSRGLTVVEGEGILRSLWRRSFVGWVGLEGILFFELFKAVFERFGAASHCVYFVEMHAWERALNAAKALKAPRVRSIGFQHVAVSLNHFFYFQPSSDIRRSGSPTDQPWPDVLACNGEMSYSLFAGQGYPGLRRVEAIRHLHLAPLLESCAGPKPSPPVLLVVASHNIIETMSLLHLMAAAFPRLEGFRVWFKPHPVTPAETVFWEMRADPRNWGWEIKEDPIEKLLPDAAMILGGESSVSVNALAYGCQVIAPVLNDALFMNPLGGHEDYCHKVYGPDELRRAVQEILRGKRKKEAAEARKFVGSYWDLDPSLSRWQSLLQ